MSDVEGGASNSNTESKELARSSVSIVGLKFSLSESVLIHKIKQMHVNYKLPSISFIFWLFS